MPVYKAIWTRKFAIPYSMRIPADSLVDALHIAVRESKKMCFGNKVGLQLELDERDLVLMWTTSISNQVMMSWKVN